MKSLGITYVRNLYNLSMDDLAKKVGVSKQTVSKWENGKVPLSLERIEQLKECFDLKYDCFSKELTQIEMIHLQVIKAIQDSKKISKDSDEYKNKIDEMMNLYHLEIEMKLLEDIQDNIRLSYKNGNDEAMAIYLVLNEIMKSNSVDNTVLLSFLRAVTSVYDIKDDVLEKENKNQALVNELTKILVKYKS